MTVTKQSLDIPPAIASLSAIITHDGPVILVDEHGHSQSFASASKAEHEIRRRKAALKGRKAA